MWYYLGKALDILSMTEYKNISKDNLKSQERSLTRLIRLISENNFEEFLQGKNKKYRLKFNFYLQKLPSKQYRRKSKRISKRNSRKWLNQSILNSIINNEWQIKYSESNSTLHAYTIGIRPIIVIYLDSKYDEDEK